MTVMPQFDSINVKVKKTIELKEGLNELAAALKTVCQQPAAAADCSMHHSRKDCGSTWTSSSSRISRTEVGDTHLAI